MPDPTSTDEARLAELDRGLTHRAFRSLPTRWQEVLWYTEVEGLGPAEAAPLLGMTAGAAKQLAFRAREGLREAWIQAHIATLGAGSECRWTVDHLGAHARGNLARRNQARVEAHLEDCPRCAILATEAQEVGSRLALALLPVFIGVSATAAYLSALGRGEAAVAAIAALPSGVVEGAVMASGGVVAAGSATTVGSTLSVGSATAGSAVAGSATAVGGLVGAGAAAGGAFSLGGLVGAGVTSVGVAGALLAVTIAPSLLQANATESGPSVTVETPGDPEGALTPETVTGDDPEDGPVSSSADPAAIPSLPATAPGTHGMPTGSTAGAEQVPAPTAADPASVPAPTETPGTVPVTASTPTPAPSSPAPSASTARPSVSGKVQDGRTQVEAEVPGVAAVGASAGKGGVSVGADVARGTVTTDVSLGAGSVDVSAEVAGGTVTADVNVGGGSAGVTADVAGGTVSADVNVGEGKVSAGAGVADGLVGVEAEVGGGIDVGANVGGIGIGVSVGGEGGLLGIDLGLGGLLR